MADIVNESRAPLARPEPVPIVSRRRFGLAYLALAVIVGAAVGLIVVLATRPDHTSKAVPWSAWHPTLTGTRGVREIARHVSKQYTLASGAQLVTPVGEPMVIPTEQGLVPIQAILVGSGNAGTLSQRVDVAFPEAGTLYQLCGANADCSVPTQTAGQARLIRREAVELALYNFHYLPDTDYMVIFLSPEPGVQQNDPQYRRAIFFDRPSLRDALGSPLSYTLPPISGTLTPEAYPDAQANAVDGLLAGRIYHYDVQPGATGAALLQLTPLVP